MVQPENQVFAFCRRMGKSRIAPSRHDCGVDDAAMPSIKEESVPA